MPGEARHGTASLKPFATNGSLTMIRTCQEGRDLPGTVSIVRDRCAHDVEEA
jgi:hypothetical protein